jgi:hypothetical protein
MKRPVDSKAIRAGRSFVFFVGRVGRCQLADLGLSNRNTFEMNLRLWRHTPQLGFDGPRNVHTAWIESPK